MMRDKYNLMMQESSSFRDRMLETACIIFWFLSHTGMNVEKRRDS
jgi:hypothetical protein